MLTEFICASCVALALSALGSPETHVEPKSEEIVAQEVCDGLWGVGSNRRDALTKAGYDAEAIQAMVNEMIVDSEPVVSQVSLSDSQVNLSDFRVTLDSSEWVPDPDGSVLTARGGINYYFDQYETYYNLPMDGVIAIASAHGIGGEYWVRSDGAKMLGEYIMLATNNDVYPIGTLVPTSLGMGISLDTGTFAARNPYQIDIAVDWE
jgi:hypothetical protein